MQKGPTSPDQGLFYAHLHRGKEHFDHNELDKARKELETANRIKPGDEKALNLLGMTYFKMDLLPEAEEMYTALAARNPNIYTLQSNLGLIQLKLGKLDLAQDALDRALDLQPFNPKAHFYLGLLCEKQRRWQEALEHFEKARADRMISKMRARMEEDSRKEELILPFEVLEVFVDDEADRVSEHQGDNDLLILTPQEVAIAETEGVKDDSATVNMYREEIVEEMEEIPIEEPPEEPEQSPSEPSQVEDLFLKDVAEEPGIDPWLERIRADRLRLEQIMEQMKQGVEPEELKEDLTPSVLEAGHQPEEIPPWEKTHPSIVIPDDSPFSESAEQEQEQGQQLEQQQEEAIQAEIVPEVDGSLFLVEEMAADISTFLAQSRDDERIEEAPVFEEPPPIRIVPPADVSVPEPQQPAVEDELFENRIPTPEEVENQTQDIGSEALFEKAEETVLPMENLKEEETYESELEALGTGEIDQSTEEEEEDKLEGEGVLSPSEFVPEPQSVVEHTQEILPEGIEESIRQIAEPELVDDFSTVEISFESGTSQDLVAGSVIDSVVEEQARFEIGEVSEPVEMHAQAETSAPEEIPAPQAPSGASGYQPANLDQFSRERFYFQPVIGADRFLLIDPHLLEIILSEKLFCRTGTIASYTGHLQFSQWQSDYGERVPLVQVDGAGIIFLADRRKEIFILSLNNESLFVDPNHLLVVQSALTIEPFLIQQHGTPRDFVMVRVTGRGTVALTYQTKPLTLHVQEGLPVNIPADALIAWSGKLIPEVIQDRALRRVLMITEAETLFCRFTGTGDVVVEQGGLWGDRRARK